MAEVDWLHAKNSLNMFGTATEWILMALVVKLEAELAVMRRRMGNKSRENVEESRRIVENVS